MYTNWKQTKKKYKRDQKEGEIQDDLTGLIIILQR